VIGIRELSESWRSPKSTHVDGHNFALRLTYLRKRSIGENWGPADGNRTLANWDHPWNRAHPIEGTVAEELVGHSLKEVERVLILQTLDDFEGNRTRTALLLGISVRCLRDKLRRYKDQGFVVPQSLS
jgi:DNA-binding NtrC family response regulator